MPMYEYRCASCGKDFERYVATSAGVVACPACASGDVKRRLSVFALRNDGGLTASSMPSGGGCCSGGGCSCH
jgi:putative FmdB family regulatory protein